MSSMDFKIKGSRAEIVTPVEYSGSNTLQKYNQGVYVNDISTLINPSTVQLRPNNDYLKIKNGVFVQALVGAYDDTEAPVTFGSATGKSTVSFSSKARPEGDRGSGYAIAPSHFLLDNDLGQPDSYQDGTAFEETTTRLDPVVIIQTDPEALVVPFNVVNAADQTSMDGLIDVFDTRKKIERELEIPFSLRGTRGDLGIPDTYRRSLLVEDQVELISVRKKEIRGQTKYSGTDAFLDAGSEFGWDDIFEINPLLLSTGSKSPEGYVKPPTEVVAPFVERVDRELVAELVSITSDIEMRSVILSLTGSGYYPTHDYLSRNHVSLSHGFDYDTGDSRIDSRAFGGLLK